MTIDPKDTTSEPIGNASLAEDADESVEILPPQEMLSTFEGVNVAGASYRRIVS